MAITLPALRERPDDLAILAGRFLDEIPGQRVPRARARSKLFELIPGPVTCGNSATRSHILDGAGDDHPGSVVGRWGPLKFSALETAVGRSNLCYNEGTATWAQGKDYLHVNQTLRVTLASRI